MARKQKGRKPEYIIYHKFTGDVKETVFSKYAAKTRALVHNNIAYTEGKGNPFLWKRTVSTRP